MVRLARPTRCSCGRLAPRRRCHGPRPPAPGPFPRALGPSPRRPPSVARSPSPPHHGPQWDGGLVLHPRGTPLGASGGPPAVPLHAVTPARHLGVSGSVLVGIFSLGPSARGATANTGRWNGRQCLPKATGANLSRLALRGPSRRRVSPRLRVPMQTPSHTSICFCREPLWHRSSRGRLLRFATSSGSGPQHPPRGKS